MIRYVRALSWLRWRMFVNAFKGTKRRDALERISRAGSAIIPFVLGILFVPAFLGSCAFSIIGGWAVGQRVQATPEILMAVRVAFGIATGIIIFIPAIRSARRPASNLVRLTLLPIPRQTLHAAEMLAGLTDPWIALLVPWMILFPLGIALGGRPVAALVALLSGLALLLALLALESSVGNLLALLYRDRRRGEIVTLVVLLTLSLSGMIPAVLSGRVTNGEHRPLGQPRATGSEPSGGGEETAPLTPPTRGSVAGSARPGETPGGNVASPLPSPAIPRENEVDFPIALSVLPSELYARATIEPLRGRFPIGLLAMLGIACAGAVLYELSWVTYRRLLDSPETMSRRRGARAEPSMWALPGFSPASSAVALAQIRLVLRTVHGKMAVLFTPVSILIMVFMMSRIGRGGVNYLASAGPYGGPLMGYAGTMFTMIAPQRFMLNIFAVDGAGLTLALLSPISERQLVAGKAAGMAMLSAIPMAIILIVIALFAPPASLWLWGAVILSAVSAYMVLAPASAMISAIFPKTADLNRMSAGPNPNGIATLLGMALIGVSSAPPALLATLLMLTTGMPALAFLAVLVWAGIAAAVSLGITQLAARVVATRRENLALVAQGR